MLESQPREIDARRYDPFVMVGVDADTVTLQVECVLTVLHMLQLVLVEVRPPPDASINNVRKTFSSCDLKPTI